MIVSLFSRSTQETVMETTHTINAAGEAVHCMASSAHEAVDKIANASAQAAETVSLKGEQLKELEVRWLENCQTYVRDNPVRALGIALVSGFFLSRLLSRH
jgi:ElaB/YqjD/DUF883 family membrane-anchored ribosome-binding protein